MSKQITTKRRMPDALDGVRDIERQARRHRCAWRRVEQVARSAAWLAREEARAGVVS